MRGIRDPSLTWARRPARALDLTGKTFAVVGGTNGLGRAIAKLAAARGARAIVVGRTFRDGGVPRIEHVAADLASMEEADRIGRTLDPAIDVVVLTTGIFAAPRREVTSEGIERDLAVSYLSRLVLLRALAPRLARRTRVFVMGFPGTGQAGTLEDFDGATKYDAFAVHMNTVAGNEALVLDAVQRHPDLDVFGLNPGLIKTDIRANYLGEGSLKHRLTEALIGLFMPSPETYAERILPLLVAPELERRSGAMFDPEGHAILPTPALDRERVAALIATSERLVAPVVSLGG